MTKNSTFFFIYDNLKKENELFSSQELLETEVEEEEIAGLLRRIEFSPPDRILRRIFEKAYEI
jgi:hypothetical protein